MIVDKDINQSSDGGKTYQKKTFNYLFASFFFISEDMMTYQRNLYTFLDLLSDFGGLYQTFVLGFFVLIGSQINKTIVTAKMIRASLFVCEDKSPNIYNV